mgnify:CR=1 FL=1
MKYNAENGYGLKLTKFDEQYEDCIIYRSTKEEIIRLADNIIRTFNERGLLDKLIEMQTQAMYYVNNNNLKENEFFKNKFEIPSYFINLLLEKYNMKVLGW